MRNGYNMRYSRPMSRPRSSFPLSVLPSRYRTVAAGLISHLCLVAATPLFAAVPAAPAATAPPASTAAAPKPGALPFRPFFDQHCVKCHSGDKPKGDWRIDELTMDFSNKASRDRWAAVQEK